MQKPRTLAFERVRVSEPFHRGPRMRKPDFMPPEATSARSLYSVQAKFSCLDLLDLRASVAQKQRLPLPSQSACQF